MGQNRHPVIRVFDCHVARPAAGGGLEFLLLHRAPGRIYAGDWRMVGGKLEGEETAWQACIRELQEETGLVPSRLFTVPFLNRFYEWSHDRVNEIPVFLALTSGTDPTLDGEHDDFAWLSPAETARRLPWPGQRGGLDAAATLYADERLWPHLEIRVPPGPESLP
ncbi:MAG: NUDIX pyrophosphatase [Myxococcota bacterium]|nr:NUDIX pyrophosphatase [Myxococcota bacterium]